MTATAPAELEQAEALEWLCAQALALEALCELAAARDCAPEAFDFVLNHLAQGLVRRLDLLRAQHLIVAKD